LKIKISALYSIYLPSILLMFAVIFNMQNLSSQQIAVGANNVTMQAMQMQHHAVHITDNLIVSEHIPLTGNLLSGDYILLMDFTPFATSVEGHSHIALKIPCDKGGSPKATVISGVAPRFKTLNIGQAITNGTLDGKGLDLSDEGYSCLYHTELPIGITDLALVNTSNETLNFNEGGYSATVTVHGTAIQHLAANETGR
jgi:acyl-[acyl carrier protein]--UDP-N-acetylglucosamine O-acyltransferase